MDASLIVSIEVRTIPVHVRGHAYSGETGTVSLRLELASPEEFDALRVAASCGQIVGVVILTVTPAGGALSPTGARKAVE